MKIYKLKYESKESGLADLLAKGVLIESENGLIENKNVLGIVHVGKIIDVDAVYNSSFDLISSATYVDGYHIDLACTFDCFKFDNEIFPIKQVHTFSN